MGARSGNLHRNHLKSPHAEHEAAALQCPSQDLTLCHHQRGHHMSRGINVPGNMLGLPYEI